MILHMDVYLKPNTVMEPLFDQWYAWPHLISPATAAMNVTGRHLRIMQSFLKAPELHATAVRTPKMKGGPFMDVKIERMEEVRQLMEDTYQKREYQIAFSTAIRELDQLLKSHKSGYSMEYLYELVPEILKGYVELVYDLNNHPAYRLFESLLYRSKLYDPLAQSIALWVTNNDERPFVLSTPRLKNDTDTLHFQIPFSHAVIDELGKMKRQAADPEGIKKMLGVAPDDETLFASFFTTDPPPVYKHYKGDKIRIRYFGHACILAETKDVSLLIDPLISYYGYDVERTRFSDADLPDVIDYVLITHNHQDHILFETLLPIRHRIRNLVVPATTAGSLQDPNLKLMFNQLGFRNVLEIHELESIQFEDITITGIPFIGEHGDLNIHAKMCHHVRAGEFSMLFVADACNIEPRLYQHIREVIGKVDVVFLGMECDGAPLTWLYGPLLTTSMNMINDQSRRLAGSNFERGKALIEAFDPKEVYVYAMGMEPWLEFISSIRYTATSTPIIESDKLVAHCRRQGKVAERLFGEKELFYEKFNVTQ